MENDPGVLTQLIKNFGVKGVQVVELWSIEDSIFEQLRPVHGLIFLFRFIQNEEPPGPMVRDSRLEKIYFSKQIINNACTTQAAVTILLNCNHPDIDIGVELAKLKDFSMSLDPVMRGLAFSNCLTVKNAHNAMAQQIIYEGKSKPVPTEDEGYHFIGYMPIDGKLYELDGMRDGPIDHGSIAPKQDWLDVVRPIIMKRITYYTEGEIYFNLMAVVSDRKLIYERQLGQLWDQIQFTGLETENVEVELPRIRILIEYEEMKTIQFRQEMIRRRHDYVPFIVMLLKILAEERKLAPLMAKARERVARRSHKRMKT